VPSSNSVQMAFTSLRSPTCRSLALVHAGASMPLPCRNGCWKPAPEASQAFPRQGVASVFRYARAAGVAEGVIAACGISIEYVSPAHWKRAFHLSADKEASRALAIARFPDAHAFFTRKRDHGAAEACLLALYGAQTVLRIKSDTETPTAAEVVS